MKDVDGSNVIELAKTLGDTKIIITFTSRSPDLGDEEEEEDDQ